MKYIDRIENENEILNEIVEQSNNFNIKEFCLNEKNIAIGIITPRQTIYAYCEEHIEGAKAIYRQMYDNFNEFRCEIGKQFLWQEESANMGNICIQLCSSSFMLVYIPKQINMYQFMQLYQFNKDINKYYNKESFEIITNAGVTLNEAMNEISKKINNNIQINEKEIILKDKLINNKNKTYKKI